MSDEIIVHLLDIKGVQGKQGAVIEDMDKRLTEYMETCDTRHKATEQYIHDQKLYGKAGIWLSGSIGAIGVFLLAYGDKMKAIIKGW